MLSLEMYKQELGESSHEVMSNYSLLGYTYLQVNEFKNAYQNYHNAFLISKKIYGEFDPKTANSLLSAANAKAQTEK